MTKSETTIDAVEVATFIIPTDLPESDGTIEWDSTTLVLATVQGGGRSGLGYTYADRASASLIHHKLGPAIQGRGALAVRAAWDVMVHAVRNLGRPGLASAAISAVDVALWDLKAKLLDQPLTALLGQVRAAVPVYGSGGFTSYTDEQLMAQLAGWAEAGIRDVKMKVGREPGGTRNVCDWLARRSGRMSGCSWMRTARTT